MYMRKVGIVRQHFKFCPCVRLKHDNTPSKPDNYFDPDAIHENPMTRAKRFLKRDLNEIVRKINDPLDQYDEKIFPKTIDVLIVGGGVIGSSIAYWLQNKCRDGLTVAVVDKDLSVNKNVLTAEEVLNRLITGSDLV